MWHFDKCRLRQACAASFLGQLRVILHTLDFFYNLQTVCFMYGLYIYEIKKIGHHARIFIIAHGSFSAFYKISKKNQVLNIKLKYL